MLLTVGDKQYAVHFSHQITHDAGVGPDFRTYYIARWKTHCSVHEGRCGVKGCADKGHPYYGVAACHEHDQFSKVTGRKISLGRALQSLPRETRRLIWTEYFKICPHK